jgi:hypothetical protein
MFELVLYCREEWRMGNKYAHTIMLRGLHYLVTDLGPCSADAAQLVYKLIEDVKT